LGTVRRIVPSLLVLVAVPILVVALEGCGGGSNNNDIIVAPMIRAKVMKDSPTQIDRVVFLDNVTTAGNIINADVMLQDTSGSLSVDDIDVVLRYDATFLQVTIIRPETLFGTCGTVNLACNLLSPVCLNNQSSANGGGQKFCRSNGSTFCLHDTDCTSPGDFCGDFGALQTSFAVITGPKTCSNKTTQSCLQSSDCQFCTHNSAQACSNAGNCSGPCLSFVCSGGSFNGRACSTSTDCVDTCGSGVCSGCPSAQVNGKVRIVNLTFQVISTGVSDVRFVVSSSSTSTASFLREATSDLSGVQFWPNVDAANPSLIQGAFTVTGTK
jgi:hypothetical protein